MRFGALQLLTIDWNVISLCIMPVMKKSTATCKLVEDFRYDERQTAKLLHKTSGKQCTIQTVVSAVTAACSTVTHVWRRPASFNTQIEHITDVCVLKCDVWKPNRYSWGRCPSSLRRMDKWKSIKFKFTYSMANSFSICMLRLMLLSAKNTLTCFPSSKCPEKARTVGAADLRGCPYRAHSCLPQNRRNLGFCRNSSGLTFNP